MATYILSVHSKGISSLQLATWLGVTQKTAWHLNHRIREMLTDIAPELLEGIVEVDETYVGGILKNIYAKKKEKLKGLDNKTMVFGAVQRNGKVRSKVIPQTNMEDVGTTIEDFVAVNSFMVSDENHAYNKVGQKYKHRKVNHRDKEYVRKDSDLLVHTNNIEGYWNILKNK